MDVRIEKKRKSRTIQFLSTKITQFATLVEGIERKRDKLKIRGQEDNWNKTVGVRAE
jgi:ppGpp synthetase/RelA/SpoT-type nucleotidyltranferase